MDFEAYIHPIYCLSSLLLSKVKATTNTVVLRRSRHNSISTVELRRSLHNIIIIIMDNMVLELSRPH